MKKSLCRYPLSPLRTGLGGRESEAPCMTRRYVIVGNGFAGTTAAEHLRRIDATATIDLFGDESYPLYNRIALPPMLRGQIAPEKVLMRDIAWHERHAIRLHIGTRVEAILPDEQCVVVQHRRYPYDALLLATGGRVPPARFSGSMADTFTPMPFQSLDDAHALLERLADARCGVAVGGSFIAYELVEAFVARGLEAHWVIRGSHILRRILEPEAAALLDEAARLDGVHVHYNDELYAEKPLSTKHGHRIDADLVAIGLGIHMNTELAVGTDIAVRTGFLCDDRLETTVPGIFAAGDVAEFFDPIAGMHYRMGTWNNAGAHGRVVAVNMAGGDARYHDVPEYSSQIFRSQAITQFGISPELRPNLQIVSRLTPETKEYRALFFDEGRLAGGVLIGKKNRAGKRRYLEAIKARQTFAADERNGLLDWTAM